MKRLNKIVMPAVISFLLGQSSTHALEQKPILSLNLATKMAKARTTKAKEM